MKKFSNTYIFLYITGLVIVITGLLTAVAIGLKPQREANRQTEKAQQILYAAGYGQVDKADAATLLAQVAQRDSSSERETYRIRCADGQNGWVVAVDGKGLWGPIWGYVTLSEDRTTLLGTVFAHKSETPGLGDRITTEKFSKSFIGKKLYNEKGEFVSVRVLPSGKAPNVAPDNRVDAISGATLTSKGVDAMLRNCLNDK